MSYSTGKKRRTVYPPTWAPNPRTPTSQGTPFDDATPATPRRAQGRMPPVLGIKNENTQNSADERAVRHYPTSAAYKTHGYIQLGGTGFVYMVAEDRDNQAFLAYPLSGPSLKAEHQNIHHVMGLAYDFAAQELMSLSLSHLKGSVRLEDVHVASISKPILEGLEFLHSNGLGLGMSCSTVQLDYMGNVKIAAYENCREFDPEKDLSSFPKLVHEFVEDCDLPEKNIKLETTRTQLSDLGYNFVATVVHNKKPAGELLEVYLGTFQADSH
ncbi:hypothetical protein IF1G_11038 [Cordyceps javanica]|uniref:Protein kinase-like domain n=1 Tax=Cordyceps javanica TaxID=43265 RepID=A0A545VJ36_9HYPO|nr:hypothetical protein IF1G_11038 [Cordyceps javanica]TQW01738.1 hypothetical protein IF2G_10720 [Cordyceps javanica]